MTVDPTNDLMIDVKACDVGSGQCAIWWLGQHSFVLKLGQTVVYLDPFLTAMERRNVEPLFAPADVTNAAIITGSHDHADHIDRPVWPILAESSPDALFVVPELLRPALAGELRIPQERFVGLDDQQSVDIRGVRITGIAAAHEFLDRDAETGRCPYLGFVIEANGVTVYHSGDTCLYEGLLTKLARWDFDVVMLPINGRDAVRLRRGCIGNMTYQEAADLAGSLKPGLTIPAHFDMFNGNTENPALFTDYMAVKYPDLRALVPQHGCRINAGIRQD